jgi:hypothetical protein
MMCHVCSDMNEATICHQRFKRQVISPIPGDMGWILSGWAVESWLVGWRDDQRVDIWPQLLPQHRMSAYTAHG